MTDASKEGSDRPSRKPRASGGRDKPDGKRRANLIRAIDHPTRRRILRRLKESDEPRSPAELERERIAQLSSVSYHVMVLRGLEAIERAGQRQVRGALEHFYETTIVDDPPIEALLEETREFDGDGG